MSIYQYLTIGLPSTPESDKKLDLSEVEIDDDPEALDAFLQSDDTSPSGTHVLIYGHLV